jgi:hypothetical protein
MYDVLFADGITKCFPSGFTEKVLRHEKNSIEPTKNTEPTCNTSSDDESEDEDGSRDGDDSWPVESEDDLEEQASEWEAWVQRLENLKHFQQGETTNLQKSDPSSMVLSGTVPAMAKKFRDARTNVGVSSHRKKSVAYSNGSYREGHQKQKAKKEGIGHKLVVTRRVGAATPNVGAISDLLFPAADNSL